MFSSKPSSRACSKPTSDRHLNKIDRHKEKKDRHKNKIDSGHNCICGYSKCNVVREGFTGTGHIFDRRPIHFKIPKPCKEWDEFFDSLIRNLHVSEEVSDHLLSLGVGTRFDVRAHHFTEEVVRQYWNPPGVRKCWAKRFEHNDARELLHLPLDKRDTDANGKYFLNANHPMHDAASLAITLKSSRGDRASCRLSDDSEKESMRFLMGEKNESIIQNEEEIQKLRETVIELKKEVKTLKQTSKRRKDRVGTATSENKQLRVSLDDAFTLQDVADILVKMGGLNRANLFNKKFHKKYPGASKCLWGFESYKETLVMVECLFEDVDVSHTPSFKTSGDDKLAFDNHLTPLEQCLICKLFFRRDLNEEFIALIFGKHRTTIGKVLKKWAPRWGKAGEQLSILDVTKEYLDGEEPERSKLVGVTNVVTVDGTDTTVEKNRKDPTAAALEYGSKNKCLGTRSLNWATATCLAIEHTKEFCARASEKAVYDLHGSLGKRKAPLKEWQNIGHGLEKKQKMCRLKVGTEDMFDYHDMEQTMNTIKALGMDEELAVGAVDDGVLLTATLEEVDEMPGANPKQSTGRSRLPPTTTKCKVPTIKEIDDWFVYRETVKTVHETSDKLAPLIEVDVLKQQNTNALEGGVNSSGIEKLAQYEVHERLHIAYENKHLKKTTLSHFLSATKRDRHMVLKWLGSDLAPTTIPMPVEDELPDIWLRLSKIPPSYGILGDKGFYKADRLNPNINVVRTPWKLSDDKVQEYKRSAGMIQSDRETSDTRVVVEDDYERYRNETILKGVVPYWVIAMLPYAHEWGHANMNLLDPVRRPGNSAEEYWDKHT